MKEIEIDMDRIIFTNVYDYVDYLSESTEMYIEIYDNTIEKD